jgi:outer membrane receptor protein involved in Fe transport
MSCHEHFKNKKRLLAVAVAASALALAVAPGPVRAQTADATLRGHAPPGATVTAKSVATGAVRVTRADKDGSYALVGLRPGTYSVDAGPGTAKTVTLRVASTGTLNLAAATPVPSAVNATNLNAVTVTATTLQEVRTSEVGTEVSLHQIETTPRASRNFLEFADSVPGMVFTRSANGDTSLRAGAQASSAINVYIDGVGQKNYVLSGGVTGQNNSQGNPFPELAIGEYKVITSNYKAEFDQISSAALTAVSKSGTNEFHGDVFGNFTNTSMRAKTPSEEASHEKTQSHEKDYGFDLGGPIVKDKAHFYITYEGKEFDSPITVVPGGDVAYHGQLPADVSAQLGPADLPFKENDWFGKLDFEPTDRDRVEITGKYRDETAISNVGGTSTASAGLNTINYDKRYVVRWDHSADSWFNSLQATYENAFYHPEPVVTGIGNAYYPVDNQNQLIVATGNSPLAEQDKGQKGPSIQDDLTFNDLEWHGDHVVKMGVKYKLVDLTAQDSGDSNALFGYAVTRDAGTESIPFKVIFGSPVPGKSPSITTSDRQFGAYVQDDWDVNDHLTLNLGLRWDYDKTPSYLDYVTPPDVVAALYSQDPNAPAGQTYAQTLAKGGVDVADYISNGHNRHAQRNEWQPRFGFSYDIDGDERHVVFGGFGRSYDRNLYEALQVEQTKSILSQPTLFFDTPGVPCTVGVNACYAWDPSYLDIATLQSLVGGTTAGKEVDMVNNHLKTPYSEQVSLGMRNQVGEWNTSVTLVSIRSFDGLVYTLGNRYPDGSFWQNGSQPWGNGIPGFGSLIIGNNGLRTKTKQILLEADKPYTPESLWGATIAYTYSATRQNHDNNDPTDQYAFDFETIANYPYTGSGVAKHRLVATGTLDGPWGLVFGGKLTLSTPIPDLNLACYGLPATGVDHGSVNGGGCQSVSIAPPGTGRFLIGGKVFGYRDIDLQATKNFKIWGGLDAYARLDLINAFNWKNYTSYIESWGADGVMKKTPVIYDPTGQITGYPRTLRFEVGLKF